MTATKRPLRVFLCHSSGDKPDVRVLFERLVKEGIDAWLDIEKLIPGQDWQVEISKAVKDADVVVVCLSSQSVTREGFVQKEIKFALDVADKKPEGAIFIIPARLENCDVPERITRFHWVDLFSDDGYERLLKALQICAARVGATIRRKPKSVKPLSTEKPTDSVKMRKSVQVVSEPIRKESISKSYIAKISRSNPALFVFLIDQSASMADSFSSYPQSRASAIAEVVNGMILDLVMRASWGENVRDYFHLAVLGYGLEPGKVSSVFGKDVVSISELALTPIRTETRVINQINGQGEISPIHLDFPIWLEPVAVADAPMCQALRKAYQIVNDWIKSGHVYAFPPIVINLTDGAATDGDPLLPAKNLMRLATNDGNVLLFNCCLSYTSGIPIHYPEHPDTIPDEYGKVLFEMSSPLTPRMRDFARAYGYSVGNQARGFTYQADLADVIRFFDIGTRHVGLQ
jgi:hypothetical protein